MIFVTKRISRKLKMLKFSCPRCKADFRADLYPNCDFEYDHVLNDSKTADIDCFTRIVAICPDCGKLVQYNKRIDMYKNGVIIK